MNQNAGKQALMAVITVLFGWSNGARATLPKTCATAYFASDVFRIEIPLSPSVNLGSGASVQASIPYPSDPQILVYRANGFPYDPDHFWNAVMTVNEPKAEGDGKIALTVLNFFAEKPPEAPAQPPDGDAAIEARVAAAALLDTALKQIGDVDRIRMSEPVGEDHYVIQDALVWGTPVDLAVRRTLLVEALDRLQPGAWTVTELPSGKRGGFTLERAR